MIKGKPKIAVWGLGNHAINKIIPAIISCSDIDLLGVYSRNLDVVKKCAEKFQCKSWSNENELLTDSDLDVIYVSTPIALHAEQGEKILNAGKHFWCEKPITSNYNDALKLSSLAESKSLTMFEAFMYFYHPQFIWLNEYLAEKKLGEIKSINIRFGLPFLEQPGFRYSPELGGSSILDVGCYPISAALKLFPEHNPIIKYVEIKGMEDYEVDMEGKAFLHFATGVDVYLEWGMGRSYRNEIDIWGTEGSLFTDKFFSKPEDYEPVIYLRGKDGKQKAIRINSANHFILMFKYFASSLLNNDKALSKESKLFLKRMRLIDKIKEKSEFKKII